MFVHKIFFNILVCVCVCVRFILAMRLYVFSLFTHRSMRAGIFLQIFWIVNFQWNNICYLFSRPPQVIHNAQLQLQCFFPLMPTAFLRCIAICVPVRCSRSLSNKPTNQQQQKKNKYFVHGIKQMVLKTESSMPLDMNAENIWKILAVGNVIQKTERPRCKTDGIQLKIL